MDFMTDLVLTDDNFEQEVIKSDTPVLVDFWAPWCGPCKILEPVIDELAKEYEGKIKIGKVNVDENPNSASKYGIMSIPSIFIFKNSQPVKSMIGVQSKEKLKGEIEAVISS